MAQSMLQSSFIFNGKSRDSLKESENTFDQNEAAVSNTDRTRDANNYSSAAKIFVNEF